MNFKKNEGITLMELVVAMATASLVFAAAATLLLMGLRINNLTTGTTIRQNKTRAVLTVLERLATEGKITGAEADEDSWTIKSGDEVRFCYISEDQAIYVGDPAMYSSEAEKKANIILDGVYASHVVLDESKVLTLAVQTEDGSFTSSVYCRMLKEAELSPDDFADVEVPDVEVDTDASRMKLIELLQTQYRLKGGAPNKGVILSTNEDTLGQSTGQYYSHWYITTNEGLSAWGQNGWNKDTPWCACFVSWALAQETVSAHLDYVPKFAEVDGFMQSFRDRIGGQSWKTSDPKAGDLVFFDWSTGNDPDHVGIYLNTIDGYVYTIEGNSAGMVAVRRYSATDSRIIGYGVLSWNS